MFNIWIFIIKTFSLKLITLNLTSGTYRIDDISKF